MSGFLPSTDLSHPALGRLSRATSVADDCLLGALSLTKYHLKNSPTKVTVTRRHHPLQGQRFDVLFEGKVNLTIKLPNGSSMRILRSWTDADGSSGRAVPSGERVFTVDALRELLTLTAALKQRG